MTEKIKRRRRDIQKSPISKKSSLDRRGRKVKSLVVLSEKRVRYHQNQYSEKFASILKNTLLHQKSGSDHQKVLDFGLKKS